MKSEKSKRSVRDMEVLKDIKGLLSSVPEPKASMDVQLEERADLSIELAQCKKEIGRLDELTEERQRDLGVLEKEKQELVAELTLLRSRSERGFVDQQPAIVSVNKDIEELESTRSELASAISELEELLQLKLRELWQRIARVYQEAGDTGMAMEFRRASDQMQSTENLVYFVRALLGQ